jgi:ATP-dependent Clp protease ATP-binding subunit ClpC
VLVAREEAARLDHSYVGGEHILLGLLREPESVGCRVLSNGLGIALDAVRTMVEAKAERGPGCLPEERWLSPSGKAVIDLTFEEARGMGDSYIGTEHLLIGLLRDRYGLAAQVLTAMGADLERVRTEVKAAARG